MDRPYIEWLRVENFRCIRKVDVHLSRLHAFIGPNDSGKSSLLRALLQQHFTAWVYGTVGGYVPSRGLFRGSYPTLRWESVSQDEGSRIAAALGSGAILHLDPDDLRRPANLIPSGHALWFQNERGLGLGALIDALQSRDVDAFLKIRARFVELFPTVKTLRLENASPSTKALGLTLVDGTQVGPNEMSEGMLYWLAFAVVESLAPQSLLLVEEPENGLHPSRVAEVMTVLRAMSARTQIVVATHSPLVINEMQPDEVTVVTRTVETGTICTPMTETKNFAERSKVYALGELWLSYADGELEKELMPGGTDAAKAG
jgi:predicted ATPase